MCRVPTVSLLRSTPFFFLLRAARYQEGRGRVRYDMLEIHRVTVGGTQDCIWRGGEGG